MSLFTAVLEFRGGTYIAQVKAANIKKAVERYANELLVVTAIGTMPTRRRLANELSKEEPVPLKSVENVWCCSAIVTGDFALLNIIRTVE